MYVVPAAGVTVGANVIVFSSVEEVAVPMRVAAPRRPRPSFPLWRSVTNGFIGFSCEVMPLKELTSTPFSTCAPVGTALSVSGMFEYCRPPSSFSVP